MNLYLTLMKEMEPDVVKHKQPDPGTQPAPAGGPVAAVQDAQGGQGAQAHDGGGPATQAHPTPAAGGRYTRDADGNLKPIEE